MKISHAITLIGLVGLGASHATAGVRTIDMVIQSDTFDNFQFSVLHSASSNGGQSGNIHTGFTGTFTIEFNDQGTNGIGDDTITFTSFNGVFNGSTRSTDMRLDSARGASVFSRNAGGNNIDGNLNIEIWDSGGFKDLSFNFSPSSFNDLANRFFEGGDPQDASAPFTLGLWGIGDVLGGETVFGDSQIGIDLVGRAIPMPTPLSMAGLGLLGVAGMRRRR